VSQLKSKISDKVAEELFTTCNACCYEVSLQTNDDTNTSPLWLNDNQVFVTISQASLGQKNSNIAATFTTHIFTNYGFIRTHQTDFVRTVFGEDITDLDPLDSARILVFNSLN